MNNWMKSLTNIGLPQSFHITYIVEILILTVIIYELLIWVKNTRAWTLLKGIVVVTVFALGSYFFHLTTLTWIMSKTAGVLVTVVVHEFSAIPGVKEDVAEIIMNIKSLAIKNTSATSEPKVAYFCPIAGLPYS